MANAQTTNSSTKGSNSQPQKYVAKGRDGKPREKNMNANKGNINNNSNKEHKQNPKDALKQQAKEKAGAAALSTVMPAPVAQAVSKALVNKSNNKKNNNNGNSVLPEGKQITQSQERLNNIRNIANAANQAKKQKEEENKDDGEESEPSLIDKAQDMKAKADQVKGFIQFVKMIPPPVWAGIGAIVAIFLLGFILFSSMTATTGWASVMEDQKQDIEDDVNINNSNNNTTTTAPNQGTGQLGYPTDSRTISAGYPNYSDGEFHGGIDFPVSTGSNVYAAESGEVIIKKELNESYGYYLYIKHDNGLCTLYAHNSELLVNKGDTVTKGQLIARSGSTGNSSGPHCHFEVRTDCGVSSSGAPSGTHVNPNDYLSE